MIIGGVIAGKLGQSSFENYEPKELANLARAEASLAIAVKSVGASITVPAIKDSIISAMDLVLRDGKINLPKGVSGLPVDRITAAFISLGSGYRLSPNKEKKVRSAVKLMLGALPGFIIPTLKVAVVVDEIIKDMKKHTDVVLNDIRLRLENAIHGAIEFPKH